MNERRKAVMCRTIATICSQDCTFVSLSETMPIVTDHMLNLMTKIYIEAYEQGVNDANGICTIEFPNTEKR